MLIVALRMAVEILFLLFTKKDCNVQPDAL